MLGNSNKNQMVTAAEALPGRAEQMLVNHSHYESGHSMTPPFPEGMQEIVLGLGCFGVQSGAFGFSRVFISRL